MASLRPHQNPSEKLFIIIGSGVFGATVTRTILEEEPSPSVTVIDNGSKLAASRDTRKFVRDDYTDPASMEDAMVVHEQWKRSKIFSQFYHQTGRISVYFPSALNRLCAIDTNREALGLQKRSRLTKATLSSSLDLNDNFTNFVNDTELDEEGVVFVYNNDDGIVIWDKFMAELEKTNTSSSVEFKRATVEKLVVQDAHVKCLQLSGGDFIRLPDSQVVLSTGSWSMEILKKSGISLPEVSRCPWSIGVFTFHLQLTPQQVEDVKHIPPISVYGVESPYADGGEYFPPDMNGVVKIGWTMPFRNEQPTEVSHQLEYFAFQDMKKYFRVLIPALKGAKLAAKYTLWDAITPNQHPLISPHPFVKNLIIASAGSFHFAKYGSGLGPMIFGAMNGHYDEKYSWEQKGDAEKSHSYLRAKKTLDDFERLAAASDYGDIDRDWYL
ncbi:uncharacterized protein PV09_09382 [Verruconis gallopava]|uniref:FAD dependent oxidoreductase domain-containing protein n=1 Tax=Verruconis gallopava TaxID=253628 RepID=A0A0D2AIT8_9PEZI|nr:uncharacterized protein PV09_09382 [Verruconis gallopava]KIV98853.1 hypothetical protein PV09_09382 [Verruconis gallopava]